ncbi:hypothetical protein ACFPNZ_09280 [Microvirga aerilata]
MGIEGDQLIAISLMGVALAFGTGLFYLLVLLAKRIWTWVAGTRPQQQQNQTSQQEFSSEVAQAAPITASDLYVIRSNLDAVSRQVEDLERKLRLSDVHGTNIINLKRR